MLSINTEDASVALAAIGAARHRASLGPADQVVADRMASYLNRLLDQVADQRPSGSTAAPEGPVGPADQGVHRLFELHADRTPDRTALTFDGESLSYAELNARANQLAAYLQSQGVEPDVLVGVFMDRSLELIVSLLGILKAGGAYLPLDPGYPKERLDYMIGHAKPLLLLTRAGLRDQVSQYAVPSLCVDGQHAGLRDWPTGNVANLSRPDHLAYVVYTSGSTGQPKGVSGRIGALRNRLEWMQSLFPLGAGENCIQKTSLNFIDSVTETLAPLAFGGQLNIASEEVARDAHALWQFIERHDVRRIVLVPSLLDAMLRVDTSVVSQKLEMIICSGEALKPRLVRDTRELLPAARLVNLYGSSEVTGDVTFHLCQARDDAKRGVPLGRPIRNSRIYILDRHLKPMPKGVVGELYVAGDGLARGYLDRPDLTAEKFVPNPHGAPGERMFKSGDLARYLENGDIEYLGRSDHQVKVRGFRIELGEIEAGLMLHPQVHQAVVLAREGANGDTTLAAYVIGEAGGSPPDIDDIRRSLSQRLPDYMMPAHVVGMDAFPLLPNGKIDRRALPEPRHASTATTYVAPATVLECKLCQAWEEVLGAERVGTTDNFFALGGHSLLVMKLIGRLKKTGIDATVQAVYKHPTVAELVCHLDARPVRHSASEQASVVGTAPLMANHHWMLKRKNPHHWNDALFLEPLVALDIPLLRQAITDALAHHDGMRRILVRDEAGVRQLVQSPDDMAPWWHDADLSTADEQSLPLEIERHCTRIQVSLDLFSVLFKVLYIDLGPSRTPRLLFAVHRMLLDPVSKPVFYRDVMERYAALAAHAESTFAEKTTSVSAWSQWQWDYAQEGALAHLPYWQSRAWSRYVPLPRSESVGAVFDEHRDEVEPHFVFAELSQVDTDALEKFALRAGMQIDSVLVTSLLRAYEDWTQATALFLLFMTNGRIVKQADGIDLSRTVGWLPNYSPIMFDWDAGHAEHSLEKMAGKVKAQMTALDDDGLSYSCLKFVNARPEVNAVMNALPEFQLELSYLPKEIHAEPEEKQRVNFPMMRTAHDSFGPDEGGIHADFPPFAKAWHQDGQLKMRWGYSPIHHDRQTMQAFIDNQFRYIKAMVSGTKSA